MSECPRDITDGYDVVASFLGAAASMFSTSVDKRRTLNETSLNDVIDWTSVVPKRLDHARLVLHNTHMVGPVSLRSQNITEIKMSPIKTSASKVVK